MRKVWKLVAVLLVCFSFFSFINASEAYKINHHSYQAIVNEDGSIDITETLEVTFNEKKHGIVVNIPSRYQKNWVINGESSFREYYFPVTNIKTLSSQQSKINYLDDGIQIIFGSEDLYANSEEIYKFSYKMITKDLDLDGLEMVFLNIVTSGWSTSTDQIDFSIEFCKDFDINNVKIAYPASGKDNLKVEKIENKLVGSYSNLASSEGISVQVVLGTDYFKFKDLNHISYILTIITFIFMVVTSILFFFLGKDKKVKVEGSSFDDEGLDSSTLGLIIDEEMNEKDLLSLIIYWISKEYISVIDLDDDYKLVKNKDLDDNAYRYQRKIYRCLFNDKDSVKLSTVTKKLAKCIEETNEEVNKQYQKRKDKLSSKSSLIVQKVLFVFNLLLMTIISSLLTYWYFYNYKQTMIVGAITLVLVTSYSYMMYRLVKRRKAASVKEKIFHSMAFVLGYGAEVALLICLSKKIEINFYWSIVLMLMELVIVLLIAAFRKRNDKYASLYQKALNLREYLTSSKDRSLKALPYVYCLRLEDIYSNDNSFLEEDCTEALMLNGLFVFLINNTVSSDYQVDSFYSTNKTEVNDNIDSDSGFSGTSGNCW